MWVKNGFHQPPLRRRIITARRYATALYAHAVIVCPSLSVRPSQVGVLPKLLNLGSQKQHHTIVQEL